MRRRIYAATMALLFLLSILAFAVPVQPVSAAPVCTPWPTKVVKDVATRIFFTGSGYTPGASLYYYIASVSASANYENVYIGEWTTAKATGTGVIPEAAWGREYTWTFTGTDAVGVHEHPSPITPVPWVTIVIVEEGPTITSVSPTSGTYGTTVSIEGEGFTAGGSVSIYLDSGHLPALTTVTADEEGKIDVEITIPDAMYGKHMILVYDHTAGVLASYMGKAWIDFTVTECVEVDKVSMRGTEGETFTLTGHGFGRLTATGWVGASISADSILVGTFTMSHSEVEASSGIWGGKFTVTVTIPSGVTIAPGFYGITVPYTVDTASYSYTVANIILVSDPTKFGDETIWAVEPSSGAAGDEVKITLGNFPSSVSVDIYLGSVKTGTVVTDANGAARSVPITIAEVPAGTYELMAKYSTLGLMASTTFTVNPKLTVNVEGEWVASDTEIVVKGTGFGPEELVEITDTGIDGTPRNVIEEGLLIEVTIGAVEDVYVKTTSAGTFEVKYKASIGVPTGTTATITATGQTSGISLSADYTALMAPTITLTPHWGKKDDTITPTFTNLKPETEYQLYLDTILLTLTIAGEEKTSFETDATGAAPAMTFKVPDLPAGVYTVKLVYKDTVEPLATAELCVSVPGTTAFITVSATSIVSGQTIKIRGFNFEENEDITVSLVGIPTYIFPGPANAVGGFETEFTLAPGVLPGGTYALYVTRAADKPAVSPILITVLPTVSVSPTEGGIGDTFTVSADGLDPNTAYVVVWGVEVGPPPSGGTVMEGSVFVTNANGAGSSPTLTVPNVVPGVYYVTVCLLYTSPSPRDRG